MKPTHVNDYAKYGNKLSELQIHATLSAVSSVWCDF